MPVVLICKYVPCSQPFSVATRLKHLRSYCSRACQYAAMHKPIDPVICAYCGQSFMIEPWRLGTAHFCSRGCHDNWRSDHALSLFWEKIQQCAHGFDCPYCCWPWKGKKGNKYTTTLVRGKGIGAHRLAWELGNKRTMPDDHQAAHYCHWRRCCNFMHIHSATQRENYADSIRDKRMASGECHPHSKLTKQTATEALHLKTLSWTHQAIAEHLNVSKSTITNLIARDIWKEIPRPDGMLRQKPGPKPKSQAPL